MHIESLDQRRMFSVLAANFNSGSAWGGDFTYDVTNIFGDFALLAANFNQTLPDLRGSINDDLNGDNRLDLSDFEHFCDTAIESVTNALIRESAGPGDADFNGRIDKFDIRALGARFNQLGDWANGDFSMNQRVNLADFALAAANVSAK